MTYDLADIARKLRMNPDTIAHRTLAEVFLQALEEIDRLIAQIDNCDSRILTAIILDLQDAVTKAKERANDSGVEISTLRDRLDDAEERLRGFAWI